VWINRPRQYLPIIQSLADERFTPGSGVAVTLSLITDDGKLILATPPAGSRTQRSASTMRWPFDMGIRGAALDLRSSRLRHRGGPVRPGAFLPFIVNDSVYALPETQDFWVLFYRKDILASLHLTVPDTWDEVIAMLPVLQRFGMNFYLPSGGGSDQGHLQHGAVHLPVRGELYSPDGLRAGIDSAQALRGIRLMSDLFTVYSLPLQTPNFYDRFRTGDLPIA